MTDSLLPVLYNPHSGEMVYTSELIGPTGPAGPAGPTGPTGFFAGNCEGDYLTYESDQWVPRDTTTKGIKIGCDINDSIAGKTGSVAIGNNITGNGTNICIGNNIRVFGENNILIGNDIGITGSNNVIINSGFTGFGGTGSGLVSILTNTTDNDQAAQFFVSVGEDSTQTNNIQQLYYNTETSEVIRGAQTTNSNINSSLFLTHAGTVIPTIGENSVEISDFSLSSTSNFDYETSGSIVTPQTGRYLVSASVNAAGSDAIILSEKLVLKIFFKINGGSTEYLRSTGVAVWDGVGNGSVLSVSSLGVLELQENDVLTLHAQLSQPSSSSVSSQSVTLCGVNPTHNTIIRIKQL